jgi:hypothetical protein
MNALKHGFSSQEIVLEGESADQFDVLRAQYEAEFDPNSVMERELVDRLAALQWRLRRVPVFEAALIRARREATTTRGVYTFTITEEGMKDIDAYFEDKLTDPPQPVVKPWGAYEAACAAPSVEATKPTADEPSLHSAQMPITDPSHEAETKRDHHHNQLSSSATGLALIKDSEDHDTLSKLSRYEAGLMNAVEKTVRAIQTIRNSDLLRKK